ncbi:hemicentin-1-like isoform X3 [Mercenaria mercenaria]|uniref:hemicentin-1-like isoform X3 n=1 Tax=Mercenaria mercenaria TaxID=6596 RepID=UPI00234F918A|nr:hemicentin-1-like isoform X3 [Mercenaria mercenaria]
MIVNFCKYLILYVLYLKTAVSSQNVKLTPEIAEVIENGSLTLTCWYDGTEEVTSSRWIYSAASTNPVIVQIDGKCVAAGFLNNTKLYAWECHGNNSFSLTLKKVERRNHGEKWSCRQINIESNSISIYVKVPVIKAEITTPKRNVTTLSENTNGTFICITSPARPAATVTWLLEKGETQSDTLQILNNVTQSNTTNNEGLMYTTGTLMYVPTREVNGRLLYCIASNFPNQEVESSRVFLNITHSPDGPPHIQGFQNDSIYRVIENTVGKLSCSVSGGNPLATISWKCFNETWKISSDGKTVTAEVTWTASRNQMCPCICSAMHIESGSEIVVVNADVMYPPSRPTLEVSNVTVPSSENIRVIRHNTFLISCNSSSNPSPDFKWTVPDGTSNPGQIINIDNVQTSHEGRYLCTAENTMNASSGDIVSGTNVSYVDMEVLYPPTTPLFRYGNVSGPLISNMSMDAVFGDTFTVACVSNGQPQPDYSWTNHTVKSQMLTVTSLSSDFARTCTATNLMNETVGESREGQAKATFSVFVLCMSFHLYNKAVDPPSAPKVQFYYGVNNYINVTDSINVIEQSSFTLSCDALSKPKSSYSWYGPLTSTSSVLTIQNIKREQAGRFSCHAFNKMKRSFGITERGENNTSVHINILYMPDIGSLTNETVIEGASLNKTCPVIRGNPSVLTVQWTRDGDDRLWHEQHLVIQKVLRNDSMMYTCTVNNTMEPTAGDLTDGRTSKHFQLDVLYKSSVVDFFVDGYHGQNPVTIDENTTVEFRCNIDSNPKSTITIYFMDQILKTTTNDALALVYMSQSAGCLHAGVYVCTGMNKYNNGEPSKKYFTLNVKCFPRPSPTVKIRDRIFTAEQVPVTLSFTALAYPVPDISGYKWRKYIGSVWRPLAASENIIINTSGLQSNLTILEVAGTDYGTYRLDIENALGIFEQLFTVGPEEKPYPPTDFEHIEALNTEYSFTVRWKPGLDGGQAQTFVLRYKKISVQTWVNISIPDNDEEFMNYTLSGLASGSEYEIVIYSVNKLGQSAPSELRIKTKDIPSDTAKKTELPVTGIILGTLAALILIVILVVVFTIIVRRRLITSRLNKRLTTTNLIEFENTEDSKDESNKTSQNETTQISEYAPSSRKEAETNVDYESLKKPETVYEDIDHGEISQPQLQQYEELNKEKGYIHSYEGLDTVTKRKIDFISKHS